VDDAQLTESRPSGGLRFAQVAFVVGLYALAMAYVEAAVVVDLNGALGQQIGAFFPLRPELRTGPLIVIEAGREAATLVMLATVGILAGRSAVERLAWSAVAFGTWDIGYYAWLHVFTGWPPDLGTWDILFLIPVPWTGPVWAPLAVSAALVGFGLAVARRLRADGVVRLSPGHLAAGLAGGLLVVVSFTLDSARIAAGEIPMTYAWPVLVAGLALAAAGAFDALRPPRSGLIRARRAERGG
jgi:hypothetical protein